MSILTNKRTQTETRVRGALGLVFVAVLNLAFQPCVMAMEADTDHPCPHCPTELGQEQHHKSAELDLTADCNVVDTYSHDSRPAQTKNTEHAGDLPVLLVSEIPEVGNLYSQVEYSRRPPTSSYPGGPPLNILYCVFLK